jgi:hypothetical protein
MMQTLIAGQPMRFTLRLEDTTGAAVALDAKPVSGDFVFRDQDGVRAGTVTIEDFTTGHGYDVEFVPTTPFAIGEQISVRCAAVKNSAAIVFFEQGVVESSADQAAIMAQIATAAITNNPVIDAGTISLIEGDRYDGTLHAKLTWTTSIDYTGSSIELTIWRVNNDGTRTIMLVETGAVVSPTLVEIPDLLALFNETLNFSGCPAFEKLRFAVVADDEYTIAIGDCYVIERRQSV